MKKRPPLSDAAGPLPLGEIPSDPSDFLESEHPGYDTPVTVGGVDVEDSMRKMDALDPSQGE